MTQNSVFNIEKILKKNKRTNKYLVKWYGLKESESTWEFKDNLIQVKDMLENFENKLISRKRKRNSESKHINTTKYNSVSHSSHYSDEDTDELSASSGRKYKTIDQIEEDYIAEKIIDMKKKDEKFFCLVKWQENSNGIKPEPTFVSTDIFANRFAEMLIDLYESKVVILG